MSTESTLIWSSAALSILAGAALIGWKLRSGKPKPATSGAALQKTASKPKSIATEAWHPPRHIRILDAATLFERTQTSGLVAQIRQAMALDQGNFERDVMPLLNGLAEYVQLLPASESHHHAQPGGLLEHTLEVGSNALRLRQALKLPLGASPEEQMRLAPVWSYAVLVAAILHDIGKPVADVVIDLYGQDVNQAVARWNGLGGAMTLAASRMNATHYTVEFPAQRGDYTQHQRLPVMLIHALVPQSGLQWLASDSALMTELMGYLFGEMPDGASSAIRDVIKEADSLSVAANLATGSRVRFASARQTPLIERLMMGLRALVQEGHHLAINRPGAQVFVDPDAQHIWIVASPAADKTRELLVQRETKMAGAASLPTDNTRIFDTWAEYGVLVQAPKEFGKGSVWWVRIDIEDWSQVLTVLKFPLETLYPGDVPRPKPLAGTITPVAPSSSAARMTNTATSSGQDPAAPAQTIDYSGAAIDMDAAATPDTGAAIVVPLGSEPDPNDPSSYGQEAVPASMESKSPTGRWPEWEPDLALPTDSPSPAPAAVPADSPENPSLEQFLPDKDAAQAAKADVSQAPGQAVQAMTKAPRALFKPKGSSTPRPNAERFMAWVQQGLGTGELTYNESDAFIHFVAEGMLIVTPKAFKVYLESNQFVGTIGAAQDELRALQGEIQRAGYIAASSSDKTKFHYYRTTKKDGTPGSTITTYLVPNPQAYIRPVPAPNEVLVRCETSPAKASEDKKPATLFRTK